MRKATLAWFNSAEMDLENIAQIIRLEHLTPVIAFHAQQCVEKCFKAILEENLKKVPKDHSTIRLYALIKELVVLEVDMGLLTDLDSLYIDARYPGELGLLPEGKPTATDAAQFYEFSKAVHAKVKRILSANS